jgi:hypothetical protein
MLLMFDGIWGTGKDWEERGRNKRETCPYDWLKHHDDALFGVCYFCEK